MPSPRNASQSSGVPSPNLVVAEDAKVGVDKEHDRAGGLVVSHGGITVVGNGQVVTP
jgi:glucose-1-phosphate adenylyltransferase